MKTLTGMVLAVVLLAVAGQAALLTYDDFAQKQTINNSSLSLSTNGFGWRAGWDVQGEANYGYAVTSAPAMWYETAGNLLITNGNLACGGDAWTSAGRRIGVNETWEPSNGYDPYRKVVSEAAYIGANDTELWFAALVRQQANNSDYKLFLHSGGIAWNQGYPMINIGLSGSTWQLEVVDANNVTTTASTGISRTLNQTYLMVLRITFGAANDTVRLYVNPASIGGAAPVTADATLTVDDVYFRGLKFYPGSGPNNGYLDEVRIGESYASVTPVIPEPAALLGVLALAGLALRRGC